jgi:hypothetical protein
MANSVLCMKVVFQNSSKKQVRYHLFLDMLIFIEYNILKILVNFSKNFYPISF